MGRTIFPEYRDQYECTKYPFEDTATLRDSEGVMTIPNNIFLDAGFCFPSDFPYLSQVQIGSSDILLKVTAGDEVAECKILLDEMPDVLYFKNKKNQTVGCIVSEKARLSWFVTQPVGTYIFYESATSFAVRCNTPVANEGLLSVSTLNDTFTDKVLLVGGPGVFLEYVDGTNAIRVHILGEVLYKRAQCSGSFTTPNCLRTINGMESDQYGNIMIGMTDPGDVSQIRLNTTADGITIKKIASTYEYVEDDE